MNRVSLAVLATFVLILLVAGAFAYLFRSPATAGVEVASPGAQNQVQRDIPLLGELFGPDATGLTPTSVASWESTAARIALRFSLQRFWRRCWRFGHGAVYRRRGEILMSLRRRF